MPILPHKIIGWLVFFGGLLIIFYAVYSSYHIFIAQKPAPEIFKIEKQEIASIPDAKSNKASEAEAQAQKMISQQMQEQLKGIMPTDALPKLLNLISWSILAGILILAGGQIAGLGIKLIKT